MTREEMEAVTASHATVAGKIRALHAAGCSRSEIAGFLNRSYQQVRQVLMQDEARARRAEPPSAFGESEAPGFDRTGADLGGTYRLDIRDDGSIVLPIEIQKALGWSRGGVIIAEPAGDQLVLLSTAAAWKRVQEMVHRVIPPGGPSLVDELIADRRREAAREDQDD